MIGPEIQEGVYTFKDQHFAGSRWWISQTCIQKQNEQRAVQSGRASERDEKKKRNPLKRANDESFRNSLMGRPSFIFCLIKYKTLTRNTAAKRQKRTNPNLNLSSIKKSSFPFLIRLFRFLDHLLKDLYWTSFSQRIPQRCAVLLYNTYIIEHINTGIYSAAAMWDSSLMCVKIVHIYRPL